jgi:hypothetical protein
MSAASSSRLFCFVSSSPTSNVIADLAHAPLRERCQWHGAVRLLRQREHPRRAGFRTAAADRQRAGAGALRGHRRPQLRRHGVRPDGDFFQVRQRVQFRVPADRRELPGGQSGYLCGGRITGNTMVRSAVDPHPGPHGPLLCAERPLRGADAPPRIHRAADNERPTKPPRSEQDARVRASLPTPGSCDPSCTCACAHQAATPD